MSINRTSYHSHYTPSPEDDAESFELSPTCGVINDDEFELEAPHAARHTTTRQTTSKPSLLLAMCQTFALPFLTAGFLKVINDILNFVGPQVLK